MLDRFYNLEMLVIDVDFISDFNSLLTDRLTYNVLMQKTLKITVDLITLIFRAVPIALIHQRENWSYDERLLLIFVNWADHIICTSAFNFTYKLHVHFSLFVPTSETR